MNWNKFFRSIWQFNGLLIASAGGLSILVLLYALYSIFKSELGPVQVSDVVNIADDEDVEEAFVVGSVSGIGTSETLLVSWISQQNYRGLSYSEKETTSTRNFLFLNPKSGSQRWLFQNNAALFLSHCILTDTPNSPSQGTNVINGGGVSYEEGNYLCNQPGKPIAIFYTVIQKDTNGNKRLEWSDRSSLALSKPDGSGYVEVLSNLDQVLSYRRMGDRQLFVLVQQGQKTMWAILGLDDFKVKRQETIRLPQSIQGKP